MVCMKHKSGVLCSNLAGSVALCAERSENGSISCREKYRLHYHGKSPSAGQVPIPESQGPTVANVVTPGRMGLHPARAGLYQPGADQRHPSGRPRTGAGRIYRAGERAGQPGTAAGSGVHHLRTAASTVSFTGVGITCVGKTVVGKSYVGKSDAIK